MDNDVAVTPLEVQTYNKIRTFLIYGYKKTKNVYEYPIDPNTIPKLINEVILNGTELQKEEYFLNCLMKLISVVLFLQSKLAHTYKIEIVSVGETSMMFSVIKDGEIIENPVESSYIKCLMLKTGYVVKELCLLNGIK